MVCSRQARRRKTHQLSFQCVMHGPDVILQEVHLHLGSQQHISDHSRHKNIAIFALATCLHRVKSEERVFRGFGPPGHIRHHCVSPAHTSRITLAPVAACVQYNKPRRFAPHTATHLKYCATLPFCISQMAMSLPLLPPCSRRLGRAGQYRSSSGNPSQHEEKEWCATSPIAARKRSSSENFNETTDPSTPGATLRH